MGFQLPSDTTLLRGLHEDDKSSYMIVSFTRYNQAVASLRKQAIDAKSTSYLRSIGKIKHNTASVSLS